MLLYNALGTRITLFLLVYTRKVYSRLLKYRKIYGYRSENNFAGPSK